MIAPELVKPFDYELRLPNKDVILINEWKDNLIPPSERKALENLSIYRLATSAVRRRDIAHSRWVLRRGMYLLSGTDYGWLDQSPPKLPTKFYGSLSHTRDFAGAFLGRSARSNPVGFDLQAILTEAQAKRLNTSYAKKGIHTLGDSQLAITLLFSAHESIQKSLKNSGLSFIPRNAIKVQLDTQTKSSFTASIEGMPAIFHGHWEKYKELILTYGKLEMTPFSV